MMKRKVVLMQPEALDHWELSRSQEHERQLALLLLPHEQIVEKLWKRVAIPDSLVPVALDMSTACWQGPEGERQRAAAHHGQRPALRAH